MMLEEDSDGSKEVFEAKKKVIDNDIKVLESRLSELTADDVAKKERINEVYKISELIEDYRKNIPDEIERNEFIKKYLQEIKVGESKRITVITKGTNFFYMICDLLGITWDELVKHTIADGIEVIK